MARTLSVYWIRCSYHNDYFTQGYIGVTANTERRFKEHKRSSSDSSKHLKNAIKKYGDDLVFDVLFTNLDEELALLVESELRSSECIGWNISEGGGFPPVAWGNTYNKGRVLTDEHKSKISAASKDRVISEEARSNMSKSAKLAIRKPLSEEHKRNIAKANIGKKMSPEAIEKTRQANLGKKLSKEHIELLRQINIGSAHTDEHKDKIRKALTGRSVSTSTRNKIADANSIRVDIYKKDTMEVVALGVLSSKWSRENGYDTKSITRVALGVRKSHKGLVIKKSEKELEC